MNWRYSDHAEKPAEAAEASLPAFDGDSAALDAALVNAVEAILRRRAAAQLAKDYVVAARRRRIPSTALTRAASSAAASPSNAGREASAASAGFSARSE